MILPLIGLYIPVWVIILAVILVLLAIFDRDILHLAVVVLLAIVGWWIYTRFF